MTPVSMMDIESPVAIVGGGLVGMALAVALSRYGITACIHDARSRGMARSDQRVLALSHGSRQILEWMGIWPSLDVTRIDTVHVSQRGRFGQTRIDARDHGMSALGYTVAADNIWDAMNSAAIAADIPYIDKNRINHVESSQNCVRLHGDMNLHASRTLTYQLVVYAEGSIGSSYHTSETIISRDYDQHAVICIAAPRIPHRHTAYERFTAHHGLFALLPFGADFSVVYVCRSEDVLTLKGASDADFITCLEEGCNNRLRFDTVTPRHAFPLSLRYRKALVGDRSVWLGNSAQTLHPVAGQGFNLALRDVWCLSRVLAFDSACDLGDASLLARYAAMRHLDRSATTFFTDGVVRLFGSRILPLRATLGLGLLTIDMLSPLRRFMAYRMIYGARAWP